jgi:hypothetical protein
MTVTTPNAVDAWYAELVSRYVARPDVTFEPAFHNEVLKVHRRIFAMVVRGRLVVKLAADAAAALVGAGAAEPFETRPGRPMKQWVALEQRGRRWRQEWDELVTTAYRYVGGLGTASPSRDRVPGRPATKRTKETR